MHHKNLREAYEHVVLLYDTLSEIAVEVGEILPPKKAKSAQHYLYQTLVMLLAHKAMMKEHLNLNEEDEEPPAPQMGEPPF
jgi:hypothetical protein